VLLELYRQRVLAPPPRVAAGDPNGGAPARDGAGE
jgi:hypothetical protein